MAAPVAASPLPTLMWLILALPLPLPLPLLAASQGYRNVSAGSSLTAQSTTLSWLSPSGEFVFGFLPATSGSTENFLLAVWFAKIPEKTPVWFLRIDGATPLLRAGSRVDFISDGLLVLTNHAGHTQWTAPGGTASYAAMLDTGNFVLVGSSGKSLWESFANPTDTILPTQVLPLGTSLVARLMNTDYSNGRFKLAVQDNGDLALYLISQSSGDQYTSYWSSMTADIGSSLNFNTSGEIYMASGNGGVAGKVTSGMASTFEFYQRATIEPDGLFRHYRYPKSGSTGGWTLSEQLPDDICKRLVTDNGSGVCGYNAYCIAGTQRPNCSCPEGYSFVDPGREYKGCSPDFPQQRCRSAGSDRIGYKMVQIQYADWPLQDYEHFTGIDEKSCSDGCLDDCFCAAAIYSTGRECWRKKWPLTNGRLIDGLDRTALIKIAKNISEFFTQQTLFR